jgi:hypothetical protein
LYLITFINPCPIPAEGQSKAFLYKVNLDDLEHENITLDLITCKKLPGKPKFYGDARASSWVYVSPSGKLILYIGAHSDSSSIAGIQIEREKNGFVNMGEFASVE